MTTKRLLFIGDSNTGKSCIIHKFINNEFNHHLQPTICLDFKIKKIENNIKFHIWEIVSIKDCLIYLKNTNGIFITFDLTDRKSFNNVPEYIKYIKNEIKENLPPIFIVGTKNDLKDKRIVSFEEADIFSKSENFRYIEVSSKEEDESVSKLFNEMIIFQTNNINTTIIDDEKQKNKRKKRKKRCIIS